MNIESMTFEQKRNAYMKLYMRKWRAEHREEYNARARERYTKKREENKGSIEH